MTFTYIIAAVILLGLCIFVHELGHLIGGKMVGIKAKVFSIGYGKGFLKKKFGETTYQITLIPFGGYCQFYGEDPKEERKGESYEFLTSHPLKRVVVVVMGPVFNLLFGVLLFFMMNIIGYPTETNMVHIPKALSTGDYISPAYKAGIRSNDQIIMINDKEINNFSDIQVGVIFSSGKPLNVKVKRDNKIHEFIVIPKKYTKNGHYTMGVMPYGERVLIVRTLENDVAFNAGLQQLDEVRLVDGKIIRNPEEFTTYIKNKAGKKIHLNVIRGGEEIEVSITPRLRELISISKFQDMRFKDQRFDISFDNLALIKNAIKRKKVKINNSLVHSFKEFRNLLINNIGKVIKIENPGGIYNGIVKYEKNGFIGVESAVSPKMIEVKYGVFGSFIKAFIEPYDFISMNIRAMGMLFSGKLDVKENLRGPIAIGKIAGDVAYYKGVSAFIILMAKISIILMVMNLLPIPVVDGSYILFFLLEAIRGKPLSDKVMEKIQFVGIVLLIIIGGLVIINDLASLPFIQKIFQ